MGCSNDAVSVGIVSGQVLVLAGGGDDNLDSFHPQPDPPHHFSLRVRSGSFNGFDRHSFVILLYYLLIYR